MSTLIIDSTHLGIGSTIPSFPTLIPTLQLESCGLTGQLPTQLFQSPRSKAYSSFSINLSNNDLSGPVSPTFLTGLGFSSTSVTLRLANNRLSGEFPSSVLAGHFGSATTVTVNLANNAFSVPLTNIFASTTFNSQALTSFAVFCSSNNFDGVLPSWLHAMAKLVSYGLLCDNCKLSSVANSPFDVSSPHTLTTFDISVLHNPIVGPVPSSFFMIPNSPERFILVMSGNNLG